MVQRLLTVSPRTALGLVLCVLWIVLAGQREVAAEQVEAELQLAQAPPPSTPAAEPQKAAKTKWRPLFDGRSLKGWKVTQFGGQGDVLAKDGRLVLEMGNDMTGVTWTGEVPTTNYEISLEAMRVEGDDFFCALTFPVGKSPCSLIVGGWGGATVGLSSIDDFDASENETTQYLSFKKGQWYRVRLRVTPAKIEAWIDDEQVVDLDTKDRKISIRAEVELCRPLGLATWCTTAALRDIKMRRLPAKDR